MDRKVSLRFKVALCASIAALGAVVGWRVAVASHRPLDVEEMKIDVADIQSFAAEGGLLATQHAGASVTRNYARAHTEMWRRKVDELAQKYASREPEPKLALRYGEVHWLADQLHARAHDVSASFAQNETANAVVPHLQGIESRARMLTERLEREAD